MFCTQSGILLLNVWKTWDLRLLSLFRNAGSIRSVCRSWVTASKVCFMSTRSAAKGVSEKRGAKKMSVRGKLLELDRRMGWERGKRAIRSVRWQNNMASHWASLRLAPLRGGVVRQRAANDVLKVKPCAGLMGPEGPAVLDAVVH